MKIFVTGGTGFVGREVVRQLHACGHVPRVLARNADSARASLNGLGVEVQPGDILDSSGLAEGLNGCDAVVHLVGIISEYGRTTFERVHATGTQNMVQAAQKAGVNRFVHMSALGTRPGAPSRYHQSKWAGEESVRGSALGWTIFRPSLIYGPGDHLVNLFAGMSRFSPVLPVMGQGTTRFQPVTVESVAQAFVGALTTPASINQTYDLCGPDTLTFPQILDAILAALGRKRLIIRLPLFLARAMASLLEVVYPSLLRSPPPLNRDQLLMLQEDNTGNGAPADRAFGLKPTGFREGLDRMFRGKPRTPPSTGT